jgi:hypothetical protein
MNKLWLPILAGGIALQSFSGCDPTVRETVLTGLQTSIVGLVTAILNAFFMALSGGATSGGSTSQPVVQAVFDHLQIWLA